MSEVIVKTNSGSVCGVTDRGVITFKGIPYGASTTGKRRFLPPIPPEPWTGVRYTYDYGPISPQLGPHAEWEAGLIDEKIFGIRRHLPLSENCLSLNIWTRGVNDASKRPVMVWLHGGGFAEGSGAGAVYDGTGMAKRGNVVVVTINHRLTVFGYLHLAEIGGEEFAGSGVAGMLDIELALKWVKDNIEGFGGDPDNVMIFGESGGGAKVSTLLGMPSAKGLFHKAAIQSGAGLRGTETKDATAMAEKLMAKLEIKTNEVHKLQDVPFDVILDALKAVNANAPTNTPGMPAGLAMMFRPVVDGHFLPAHPFDPVANPSSADVPLIIGTNKDENATFTAGDPRRRRITDEDLKKRLAYLGDKRDHIISVYKKTRPDDSPWDLFVGISSEGARRASITLAERKVAGGKAPVYMYLFSYQSDYMGGLFKAGHALEIPFIFETLDMCPMTGYRPNKYELSEQMSETWTSFARKSDPNNPWLPKWEPYTPDHRATMIFNVPSYQEIDPGREELDAWKGVPFRM